MPSTIEIHNQAWTAAQKVVTDYLSKNPEPGFCGFGWAIIRPANSKFAKELVAAGLAKKDSYQGGVRVWNPGGSMTQSMYLKEMATDAYVDVLLSHGIKASAHSRAD